MKNKDMIRKVFQTLAFIYFIIQFQQSVRKYFQYPIVDQTSRIPVKDLPIPVVYACQANQFNYRKAQDNGYLSFTHFMAGILMNSSKISWQGKEGNQTYKDLEYLLLDSNYSLIQSESLLRSTNLWNVNEKKRSFLFPHGVCMKLGNLQQHSTIKISSREYISIYFVDPAKANDIRTEGTLEAKVSIGPFFDGYYIFGRYELEYMLYDHRIHDGITCTHYPKSDISYGKCLIDILVQEFLGAYGCLPPWVYTNTSNIVCNEETNIDANAMKKTPLYKNLVELLNNYEADMFKGCLPPCKTMQMKLLESSYKTNWPGFGSFKAKSKNWATVYTQVKSKLSSFQYLF
jgi:hypothetical protein